MVSLATLPADSRRAYLRAKNKLKTKIDARMAAMRALAAAPKQQWQETARRLSAELSPRYGRGFSAKSLMNLFRAYRTEGASAVLFGYGRTSEKPQAFLDELARRVETNNRVASVELEALRIEWLNGDAIPGYGTWRDLWKAKYPDEPRPDHCPPWFVHAGWSVANLRRYLPGNAAITVARDGFFAAHSLLPQKKNDYAALRPLELVVFDDVKTDWLVSVPGFEKPCELWLLVAMDAATRCILDWVSLAAVPDEEGKRNELLEDHMRVLVGNIVRTYGVPTGWKMTLKVENAKATIKPAGREALATLAGGQIEVEYTRMHTRALASGFAERHGEPWDVKGILESFFSSFHNHGGGLPGQTGSLQVLNQPAELRDRKREHALLAREIEDLPPAVHEALTWPFLKLSEAVDALVLLFRKLNNRRKHELQGFDKIELWRFPEDHVWRQGDELRRYPPSEIRRAIFEWRMESPVERLNKLIAREQASFTRVSDEALLPFFARVVKKVRHPAPYTVAWTEAGTEHTYRGELPELASGRGGPFGVKLLPGDTSAAWLCTFEGKILGAVARVHAAGVLNQEAQDRALGEVQHFRSLITRPLMDRHADRREEKAQIGRVNQSIIAAHRLGTEMVQTAKQATSATKKQSAEVARKNQDLAAARAARAAAQLADQEF